MNVADIIASGGTFLTEGINWITGNALMSAILGAGLLMMAIGKAKRVLPGI